MKINIGEILTKAWKITWKFKVLWIFGILAGCGANNNRFNFNGNSGGSGGGRGDSGRLPEAWRQFENMRPEQAMRQFWGQYAAIITFVILLLCVLWFLFYFLGIMGKTGLIKGANKADGGAESMSFGELWTESTPYFWRMFGLQLLVGLPIFLLVVILLVVMGFAGFSAFSNGLSGGGLGVLFIGMLSVFMGVMCIVGLIGMIIGLLLVQVENAIVLEDLGILQGLSRGWQVFTANLLPVIVMALILGVVGGVISLLIALPLLAILVPAAMSIAFTGANNIVMPLVIGGGCLLLYLPVLLILSGILQSYNQSVWTLTYRRLTVSPPSVSPEQLITSAMQ